MAGYMRKLQGYVYNGEFLAGATLTNGLFGQLNTANNVTTVGVTSAVKDTIFRVVEKTKLWGVDALVLECVSVGEDECWFIENEWDVCSGTDYDTSLYSIPAGKHVRMHRVLEGEQLITTAVAAAVFTAATVGAQMQPGANGLVVAVSA